MSSLTCSQIWLRLLVEDGQAIYLTKLKKKTPPPTLKSRFNLSNCVEIIFAFEGVNYILLLLSFHMYKNVQILLGVIYITASLCGKTL
jgi:hypothetical protein